MRSKYYQAAARLRKHQRQLTAAQWAAEDSKACCASCPCGGSVFLRLLQCLHLCLVCSVGPPYVLKKFGIHCFVVLDVVCIQLRSRWLKEQVLAILGCEDGSCEHHSSARRYLVCTPAIFATLTKVIFFTSAQLFAAVFYTRHTNSNEEGYLLHKIVWSACLLFLTVITVRQSPTINAFTSTARFMQVVANHKFYVSLWFGCLRLELWLIIRGSCRLGPTCGTQYYSVASLVR